MMNYQYSAFIIQNLIKLDALCTIIKIRCYLQAKATSSKRFLKGEKGLFYKLNNNITMLLSRRFHFLMLLRTCANFSKTMFSSAQLENLIRIKSHLPLSCFSQLPLKQSRKPSLRCPNPFHICLHGFTIRKIDDL